MSTGYCFLTNTLPFQFEINDRAIAFDTKTSTAIACLLYMNKSDIPISDKVEYIAMRLFHCSYNKLLSEFQTTSDKLDTMIMKYLQGAEEIRPKTEQGYTPKTFDYVQDSSAIISAFRQMYGLSMKEVQELHYWEFLALFENLSGDNAFNSIRNIRSMKIDKKHDSPERQEEIRKAKKAVALVDTRTAEQKKIDLQEQLNALE